MARNEIVDKKKDCISNSSDTATKKPGSASGTEAGNSINSSNVMNISYSMNYYNDQSLDHLQSQFQPPHLNQRHGINTTDDRKNGRLQKSQEASTDLSTQDRSHPKGIKVCIRQQPVHARMIGFAEKDRRPIDPPPILELTCDDMNSDFLEFSQNLIASVFLFATEEDINRSQIHCTRTDPIPAESKRVFNSLEGETDANCRVVIDDTGKKCLFFVFPQLSVRIEGNFRLKFIILDPKQAERNSGKQTPGLLQIFSDPFRVFSVKDFPGVKEITRLSAFVKNQGIRLNSRRYNSNQDDEGSISE